MRRWRVSVDVIGGVIGGDWDVVVDRCDLGWGRRERRDGGIEGEDGMRGDGGCGGEREGRWGEWDGDDSD